MTLPLHDRSFDLVLLSNWEDSIQYDRTPKESQNKKPVKIDESIRQYELAAPFNEGLESGAWTQSIIWEPRMPFRDFTQILEPDEEVVQEERPAGTSHPREVMSEFDLYAIQTWYDRRNDFGQTISRKIASISQTTSSTKCRRKEAVTGSGRRSVNSLWSMRIPLRSYSCHS